MTQPLSYEQAGVNIANADAAKQAMAASLDSADARVLNKIGAFASLFDARFPGYDHPVLVLKTEEPGSKQFLAIQHDRVESICYDRVNHLINDVIVMGATPLSVQDAIICGKLDKVVVGRIVKATALACREQGCVLTGGETSEQPSVIAAGSYVLTSSVVGVVEKRKIIDGSRITEGDTVLAIASDGVHTNGYSLVRVLLAQQPDLAASRVGGQTFLDAVLVPHKCYYHAFKGLFDHPGMHGMAHITGGGIAGNLDRILPASLDAAIDLARLRIPPVFKAIREAGGVDEADMLRTFNMGVGVALVVAPDAADAVQKHLREHGCESNVIGMIVKGAKKVIYRAAVVW